MEAAGLFETSVETYQTPRRCIPEDIFINCVCEREKGIEGSVKIRVNR